MLYGNSGNAEPRHYLLTDKKENTNIMNTTKRKRMKHTDAKINCSRSQAYEVHVLKKLHYSFLPPSSIVNTHIIQMYKRQIIDKIGITQKQMLFLYMSWVEHFVRLLKVYQEPPPLDRVHLQEGETMPWLQCSCLVWTQIHIERRELPLPQAASTAKKTTAEGIVFH